MRLKIIFWEDYFNKLFPKQITQFVNVFTNRLVPLFENINDESDFVAEKEYERLNEVFNPEYVDISEILDEANNIGFGYYQMMHSVRQALINIAAIALYHMFEQQINYFLKIEILPYLEEGDQDKDFQQIKKKLYKKILDFGIDIDSIPSYNY